MDFEMPMNLNFSVTARTLLGKATKVETVTGISYRFGSVGVSNILFAVAKYK
jgi:hypothetical protein